MNPKRTAGAAFAGAALVAISMGIALRYGDRPAKAAPVKPPVSAPDVPAAILAVPIAPATRARASDLLDGKAYPLSLKADQFDTSYHLVTMYDSLGRASREATKGDTVTFGGETFLVAYNVPLTSGLTHPPRPKPGSEGQLTLINMRAVQAIFEITPLSTSSATDESESEKPAK